jgi:hypothetical protein
MFLTNRFLQPSMHDPKKQWKLIRVDDQVMDTAGRFFSIGDKFSGYPKPILRKMQEKIED